MFDSFFGKVELLLSISLAFLGWSNEAFEVFDDVKKDCFINIIYNCRNVPRSYFWGKVNL